MRISIEPGDRAYDPSRSRKVLSVRVDGLVYPYVLTADSDEGYVKCLATDEAGQPVPEGDRYRTLEVRGTVLIELSTGERDWDATRSPDCAHSKVAVGRLESGLLCVDVYSAVRPGAILRMTLAAEQESTAAVTAQRLGAAAGAAAEDLCERFGDTIEPSEVARVAVEQASLLLADEARG